MNSKAWLTILAFLGLVLLTNWWWCNHMSTCECSNASSVDGGIDNSSNANNDGNTIQFNANSASPMLGAAWANFRDSIVQLVRSGKRLEITGYYGDQEKNNTTFANLGLARADSIKQLFMAQLQGIGVGRFMLKSELNNAMYNPSAAFVGNSIVAKDTVATPSEQGGVVATDSNDIIIYFPTGSATKEPSKEVDDFLKKLTVRLQASGEKALIIGHTDNKGNAAANLKLSKDRAEFVKNILVKDGVKAAQLSTDGKGDAEPIGDNATDAGRRQNRRVQIKISK